MAGTEVVLTEVVATETVATETDQAGTVVVVVAVVVAGVVVALEVVPGVHADPADCPIPSSFHPAPTRTRRKIQSPRVPLFLKRRFVK